jgi:superfamily I DNA/RNA helicase
MESWQEEAGFPKRFESARAARTSMLSMYQAKGREFDYVVLVVDDRFHSTKTSLDELRRLYYVAATRARKWLGVVYTPTRPGPVLGAVLE